MTRVPSGTSIRPSPKGQIPEKARINVVLPDPERPESSTRSPGRTRRWGAADSG